MHYLGVDFGTKRVGLALSDEEGTMGFPHHVLINSPALIREVAALIAKENIGGLVVGVSRDFEGKENPIVSSARAFGEEVAREAGIPVFFEPEDFTTQEARRAPSGERGARTNMTDASAAALILTSFLSRQQGTRH